MKNYIILLIIGVILTIFGSTLKLLAIGMEYSKYIQVTLLAGFTLSIISLYFFIISLTDKK